MGSVPPSLIKYTFYDEKKDLFLSHPLEILKEFRVVVTTSYTSANLYGAGIGKQHFTHILLDDAAQVYGFPLWFLGVFR